METFEKRKTILGIPVYRVNLEPDWVKTYENKYGVFLEYNLRKDWESENTKTEWAEISVRTKKRPTAELFEVVYRVGKYSMEEEKVHGFLEKAMLRYVTEEFKEGKTFLEKDRNSSYYNTVRFAKIWIKGWQDEKPEQVEGIFVFNQTRFVWERVGTIRIEQVSPIGVAQITDLVKRK